MRTPNNLQGKQFGLLVALQRERVARRTRWLCQCHCGKQVSIREESLLNGCSKSCGCAREQLKKAKAEKRYSLINQKFGRLLVLWRSKRKTEHSRCMLWDCKCDCGKITSVSATSLRTGKTKSCGCLQIDSASLELGQSGFNTLWSKYQTHAARRGLIWALSEAQFKGLVTQSCYYCQQSGGSKTGKFIYNGVDRINNRMGYVDGNVVPCCGVHSRMKGTMSQSEFFDACQRVVDARVRK